MGNPHLVLFLGPDEDLGAVDVPGIGSAGERHVAFPNRTNVEFVKVQDGSVHIRVWERGVGETMACGTGACAAVVATSLAGLTGRAADVLFPGGLLQVSWREDDHASLTGPAVCVFDGELDDAWMASADVPASTGSVIAATSEGSAS
jgi:diaminopimelate epimerase